MPFIGSVTNASDVDRVATRIREWLDLDLATPGSTPHVDRSDASLDR